MLQDVGGFWGPSLFVAQGPALQLQERWVDAIRSFPDRFQQAYRKGPVEDRRRL